MKFTIRKHDVNLYSNHRVIHDVTKDLVECLTAPVGQEVDVFVGVQAYETAPPKSGRPRIGIQAEHVIDRNGKEMSRGPTRDRLRQFAEDYDLLLDLSPDNEPAYAALPPALLAKVRFGPYIFPGFSVEPVIGDEPPLFFGRYNDRRQAIIEQLQATRPIVVARHGTFGGNLKQMLKEHGAVLNLHFEDGEYVEYPRLLKAYLLGKPIISEKLSPPLQHGVHYYDLHDEITEAKTVEMFGNLAAFARQYSFQTFIETALQDLRKPKDPT